MSGVIRWGILGTGGVARQFARGLRLLPAAQLLAVGSRQQATAREFAHQFNVPRAYNSYEDLVEDEDVDVVYIATPNSKHKGNCVLCLEAGKAVLCEKPFTINADEAQEVIALARRRQLFCMEAMWMRFIPLMAEVKSLIGGGIIGEVQTVAAQLGFATEVDPHNRLFSAELGGGALLDLGVYPLSLAFQLLGKPSDTAGHACIGDTGVDEQSAMILGYPQGQLAILGASLRGRMQNEAVITGERGMIRICAPFYRPHRLSITRYTPLISSPGTKRRILSYARNNPLLQSWWLRLDRYLAPIVPRRSNTVVRPFKGNGYNYEAAEVMSCLRAGQCESSTMPLNDTLDIMETMDTLRSQWKLRYPQEESAVR